MQSNDEDEDDVIFCQINVAVYFLFFLSLCRNIFFLTRVKLDSGFLEMSKDQSVVTIKNTIQYNTSV